MSYPGDRDHKNKIVHKYGMMHELQTDKTRLA